MSEFLLFLAAEKLFYDDLTQLAVADLPGLVAGASRNHGLGHSFLRHVQVHVVEL